MGFSTPTSKPIAMVIIIISMITGVTGAAMRPMVTFTPTWNKILNGDSVKMTCDVDTTAPGNLTFTWYKNSERLHKGKTFTIQSAQSRHGGNYQCRTSEDNISEAVTLHVTQVPVVLQSPPYIYEGEDLPLRCHSRSRDTRGPIKFYKNNEEIHSSDTDSEFLFANHRDATAVYTCAKQVPTNGWNTHSDETDFRVEGAASVMVTFNPNWRKILTGESLTMTCDAARNGQFYWYKDDTLLKKTDQNTMEIHSAHRSDGGTYWCGTRSGRSPKVHLEVSEGPVILQVPLNVKEGHNPYLRCHSRPRYNVRWTKFYKDGALLQNSRAEQFYLRPGIVSGRYRCEKNLYGNYYTDSTSVSIRELFFSPEIKLTLPVITEGDAMTLTCDTRLSPHRPTTELLFAFYRDGQEVQGFSSSPKYEVPSTRLEDSGNYSCTGRTSHNRVLKISQELYVEIQKTDVSQYHRYLYPMVSVTLLLILIISAFLIFRHRHQLSRLFPKRNQNRDPQPVHAPVNNFAGEEEIIYMEVRLSQKVSVVDPTEADDVCYSALTFPVKVSSFFM